MKIGPSIIPLFTGKGGTVSDLSAIMDNDDQAFWLQSLSLNTVTYTQWHNDITELQDNMRECGIEESIFSMESDNIRFDFWFYQLQGVGAVYVFRVF